MWALIALVTVGLATAFAWRSLSTSQWILVGFDRVATQHGGPVEVPAEIAATPPEDKGGWQIRHEGHVPLQGGVLLFPRTFAPSDEGYDLVIHFHGNVQIVHDSVEQAGINAALAVINFGVGSDAYRLPYDVPGAFEALLGQIDAGLAKRGIAEPKLRRLALTGWSAGYGGIESILEQRRAPHAHRDPLDAIVVLDGVHAGFLDGDPARINPRNMRVWVGATRAAAEGQLFMLLTHAEIDPLDYASTMRTHRYLLEQIGARIHESPMLPMPPRVDLPCARAAVQVHERMVPISETRIGNLLVRGFEGKSPDHHSAHLTQMASIALADLAARWGKVAAPALEAAPPQPATKPKGTPAPEVERQRDASEPAAPAMPQVEPPEGEGAGGSS
jgi:hypothetical protein